MSQRSRPLPRLQELWCGGVSVHHGVPLLRHADPEARAQARSRRCAQGAQACSARARSCRACVPARSPVFVPTGARGPSGCSCSCRCSSRSRIKSHPEWLTDLTYGAGFDEPWRAFTATLAYTADRLRGDHRRARSRCSAGCSSAATAGGRRCSSSWSTGVGGAYVAVEVFDESIVRGANGAALGLLAAWTMRDVLGRRHGREDDSDLLGVLAIAAVLVLMPLAATEASGIAGIVGGVAGLLLGLVLARLRERSEAGRPLRHPDHPTWSVAARASRRAGSRLGGPGCCSPARSPRARTGSSAPARTGRATPTMSVPSLGLIARMISRKISSPSGMPTTIAIAPSAAPPALTTPSTPRGVRPIALKIAKSRARSRRDEQQRGEQVHEADGDEQERSSRAGSGARRRVRRLTSSSVTSAAVLVARFEALRGGAGVGAGRRSCAITAVASTGSGSVAAGKISTRPSSSGSTWRPTSVSVTGSPATRTVTRVADLHAAACRRGRGRRSPRRGGRTCGRRGRRRGSARSRRRPRGRAAPAARAGDLEAGDRGGAWRRPGRAGRRRARPAPRAARPTASRAGRGRRSRGGRWPRRRARRRA